MSSPPCLENLPTELHAMILRSLIGPKSLSAAIDASTKFHEVYDAYFDKDELWTRVTINQLLDRGIKLFPPAPVVEICGYTSRFDRYFYITDDALIKLYDLVRQGKPLILGTADRKALSKLGNLVKWNVIEDLTEEDASRFTVQRINDPHDKFTGSESYWHCGGRGGLFDSWEYCFTGQSYSQEERKQIYGLIQQEWVPQRDEVLSLEQQRQALRISQLAEREGKK